MELEGWLAWGPAVWVVTGLMIVVAAALGGRSRQWRVLGRWAVGTLFVVGGAVFNAISLLTGVDYAGFADPAHFGWVTDTWRAVVGPNQWLFIGLLVVFEATVGGLAVAGGGRTQRGYGGVIAFYSALWLFGWFETVWVLLMLPPMVFLLRHEMSTRVEGSADPSHTLRLESVS